MSPIALKPARADSSEARMPSEIKREHLPRQRGNDRCAGHSRGGARGSVNVFQYAVEFVETVVCDHEFAGAFAPVIDADFRTEFL